MARVPFTKRENMPPAGQKVWDEIESSRGGGPTDGIELDHHTTALLRHARESNSLSTCCGSELKNVYRVRARAPLWPEFDFWYAGGNGFRSADARVIYDKTTHDLEGRQAGGMARPL